MVPQNNFLESESSKPQSVCVCVCKLIFPEKVLAIQKFYLVIYRVFRSLTSHSI
jgi:hypothetical protein